MRRLWLNEVLRILEDAQEPTAVSHSDGDRGETPVISRIRRAPIRCSSSHAIRARRSP